MCVFTSLDRRTVTIYLFMRMESSRVFCAVADNIHTPLGQLEASRLVAPVNNNCHCLRGVFLQQEVHVKVHTAQKCIEPGVGVDGSYHLHPCRLAFFQENCRVVQLRTPAGHIITLLERYKDGSNHPSQSFFVVHLAAQQISTALNVIFRVLSGVHQEFGECEPCIHVYIYTDMYI